VSGCIYCEINYIYNAGKTQPDTQPDASCSTTNLILVEFAVLVLLFALLLKRHDNEAYEDVDHKECDDDYVDEVEDGDGWTMVQFRTTVLGV